MKLSKLPFIFILTILFINISEFISTIDAQDETFQKTYGDQSAAIKAEGNVSIIFMGLTQNQREILFKQLDNNQVVINLLLKELNSKDAALVESKNEIEQWVKKYEELKTIVAKLPENDERAIKAKAALIEGDLEKARSAVTLRGVSLHGVSIGGGSNN
jgi:hypothetical protein